MRIASATFVFLTATVLPPTSLANFLWSDTSTVCNECTCTNADPYLMDCSGHDLTSTYTSSDTWPQNLTNVYLLYEKNSLTAITAQPALDVRQLSFRHNDIDSISDGAFKELRRLNRLDLSHNKLSRDSFTEQTFQGQFDPDYYQPSPIEALDLSYNDIHSIQEEVFSHLVNLTELDLSHNPLPVLDHHTILALTSLSRLATLRLAGVGLKQLPLGLLHSLITITYLDLSHNQLTSVPAEFDNSHVISELSLDGNPITEINADSFNGMNSLRELNISSMPALETIGAGAFSTLVSVKIIRAQNNARLSSLHPRIFEGLDTSPGIFPLQELYLNGNNLTSLEEVTLVYWDQLLVLQLQDNPWRCDCHLAWMSLKLLPHLEELDPDTARQVLCDWPPEEAGLALVRLSDTPEAFRCPRGQAGRPMYPSGSGGGTVAAVLTVGGSVIVTGCLVIGFLFWRRNKIREAYRAKQQIRYRRAAMDDDTGVDEPEDITPAVSI